MLRITATRKCARLNSRCARRALGFTLLELLIAAALSATLLALLAAGLYATTRDWERAGGRLESGLDTALGLLQIEQALTGAFPHLYLDAKENKKYLYFEGKEKSLAWVSTVAPDRAHGLMAWKLAPGKDGKGVTARFAPAFAGNPDKALKKAQAIALFDEYKLSFEYMEVNDAILVNGEGKHRWVKQWDAKKRQELPRAVRLLLTPLAGKEQTAEALEMDAILLAYTHPALQPVLAKDEVK